MASQHGLANRELENNRERSLRPGGGCQIQPGKDRLSTHGDAGSQVSATDSGVFRLASVGSYLDALSTVTEEMTLGDRSNLIFLDKCLHEAWNLGQNVILNWALEGENVRLLVIPHYAVAEFPDQPERSSTAQPAPSEQFFKSLITGDRRLSPKQLSRVAHLLKARQVTIPLRSPLPDRPAYCDIVEKMVKRYSISFVAHRAVALFDIVGFSLLTPFEQMTQLNSLAYSVNSAYSRMLSQRIDISFARSNTGDGCYLWNRDVGPDANLDLYHLMHLVLADNAIARRKGSGNAVPQLRACFHVGSCYEFHQAEGLNPTLYSYIVGDVTIELERMVNRALPGQILVGEFHESLPPEEEAVDSIGFIDHARQTLGKLNGLELSGERIESIRCYLTGTRLGTGEYTVRRLTIQDKHGLCRHAFNAKVNIYRSGAAPILLGIEDHMLSLADTPHIESIHLNPTSNA